MRYALQESARIFYCHFDEQAKREGTKGCRAREIESGKRGAGEKVKSRTGAGRGTEQEPDRGKRWGSRSARKEGRREGKREELEEQGKEQGQEPGQRAGFREQAADLTVDWQHL